MSAEPYLLHGASSAPKVSRNLVLWRRLEPGDIRTPGTEIAPESPYLEAKVVRVAIDADLLSELEALDRVRTEVTAGTRSWSTRYEPGGALLAMGGGLGAGLYLDYLPAHLGPFALSLFVLGASVGVLTRVLKTRAERTAAAAWRSTPERETLERRETELRAAFEAFADRLKEDGFRTDVRVGDLHEAERLVSVNPDGLADPATWRPDETPESVRYGALYRGDRYVEVEAELEGDDSADAAPTPEEE